MHVATTGGLGPRTVTALCHLVEHTASLGGTLVIATDADQAGDHHAARIEDVVAPIVVTIERLRADGQAKDWNDVLVRSGTS
ncbi:toprim domain-containing protein [Acidiphilium acidophilum]|uniref:toprim domain-containing protein n=1 Tax=Acidiphilium acidophilum TaxID=76588 RepID=UPI0038D1A548